MTIIKQIQAFLEDYQSFQLLTDIISGDESCAIFPVASSEIKYDTIGDKTYVREFKIVFKKSLLDEASRQSNHEWLEGLCNWIEKQTDNGNFPDLGNGFVVTDFVFYDLVFTPSEDFMDGVYSLLIRITYKKEVQ